MKLSKTRVAYDEVFSVMEKNNDFIDFDIDRLKEAADNHIFKTELEENYGIVTERTLERNRDWNHLGEFAALGCFGFNKNRTISWSDDGRQPEPSEMLVCISFPTGPYIFGEVYDSDTFNTFFLELKSYDPKYSDTRNNSLYYPLTKLTGKLLADFDSILNRYKDIYKKREKARRIEELNAELTRLNAL